MDFEERIKTLKKQIMQSQVALEQKENELYILEQNYGLRGANKDIKKADNAEPSRFGTKGERIICMGRNDPYSGPNARRGTSVGKASTSTTTRLKKNQFGLHRRG